MPRLRGRDLDPRPDASALGIIYPPNYYAYVHDAKVRGGGTREVRGLFATLRSWLFKKRIQPIAKFIELGPGKTWLDIGCGDGSALQAMREAYGVVGTGLDFSAEAARFCGERGFRAYASRFEDYRPQPGEQYDLVHSSHVIEHVESPVPVTCARPSSWSSPAGSASSSRRTRPPGKRGVSGATGADCTSRGTGPCSIPGSARTLAERAGFEHLETSFSTNGTFWTWTFHSLLRGRWPAGLNDAVFPSDYRFIKNHPWNVARIGLFSCVDAINLVVTGQSSNMLVILRKPV